MILITGGRGSGKSGYLASILGPGAQVADGRTDSYEKAFCAEGILYLEEYVRRILSGGGDPEAFAERIILENNTAAIVLSEIGSGVIPADRGEREYRERTGRIGCRLAGEASLVVRMVCGIGTVIKTDETENL